MTKDELRVAHDLQDSLESIEEAIASSGPPNEDMLRLSAETDEDESQPIGLAEPRVMRFEYLEWLTELKTRRLEALAKLGVKP